MTKVYEFNNNKVVIVTDGVIEVVFARFSSNKRLCWIGPKAIPMSQRGLDGVELIIKICKLVELKNKLWNP